MRSAWLAILLVAACGGDGTPSVDAARNGDGGGGAVDAVAGPRAPLRVTILCAGAVCGRTGTLWTDVEDCTTGAVLDHAESPDIQLATGIPVIHQFNLIPVGERCVDVFLDSNFNATLDTGDAIPSAGLAHAVVMEGMTAAAQIQLDAIQ